MHKNSGALARRYGTALFAVISSAAQNRNDFAERITQLELISPYLNSIKKNFSAAISIAEKIDLLEFMLKNILQEQDIYPEILSFLKTVLINKRLFLVDLFIKFCMDLADKYLGISRVKIVSAQQMTINEQYSFVSCLEKALNTKIILQTQIDTSLLCGFIINLNSINIDASLKRRIKNLSTIIN